MIANPGKLRAEEFELLYALYNLQRPQELYRKRAQLKLNELKKKDLLDSTLMSLEEASYISFKHDKTQDNSQNNRQNELHNEGLSKGQDKIATAQVLDAGLKALEPYKVNNALLMAAGFSSRFAPISYEKPKGVLTVRGQRLIDRQIEQLYEAGIEEIIVILGYLKEEFFYLSEKYPRLKLVFNERYNTHNNMSSLLVVKDHMRRSFICSSDNYFAENVFEDYVYESYYSVVYQQGPTDEYCAHCNSQKYISSVHIGGRDCFTLLGHVFFDEAFSRRFLSLVEPIYHLPDSASKLWEDFWIEHLDELPMRMRPYPSRIIKEFDSIDDLLKFDPDFIENSDSKAVERIISCLSIRPEEIMGFIPIKTGLNRSFRFIVADDMYVYRQALDHKLFEVDRASEAYFSRVAKELGLYPSLIHIDTESAYKLSRFVDTTRSFTHSSSSDLAQLKDAFDLLRSYSIKLGEQRLELYSFEPLAYIKQLLERLQQYELFRSEDALFMHQQMCLLVTKLCKALDLAAGVDAQLPECALKQICHLDLALDNILIDQDDRLHIIDWEEAAFAPALFDYTNLCASLNLDYQEAFELCAQFDPELEASFSGDGSLGKKNLLVQALYTGSLCYMYYRHFLRQRAKELLGKQDGNALLHAYQQVKLLLPMALKAFDELKEFKEFKELGSC